MNEPTLLEIVLQTAIPVLSLVAAIIAAVGTVMAVKQARKSDDRADQAEARAAARDVERQRVDFASRVRAYARDIRDGYPNGTTAHSFSDPWRDLLRDSPDEAGRELVVWVINVFGDFSQAFRTTDQSRRDQELANLYGEVEGRIAAWMRDGVAPDGPPLVKRSWPAPAA